MNIKSVTQAHRCAQVYIGSTLHIFRHIKGRREHKALHDCRFLFSHFRAHCTGDRQGFVYASNRDVCFFFLLCFFFGFLPLLHLRLCILHFLDLLFWPIFLMLVVVEIQAHTIINTFRAAYDHLTQVEISTHCFLFANRLIFFSRFFFAFVNFVSIRME